MTRLLAALGIGLTLGAPVAARPAEMTIRIDIRFSRFVPASVTVPPGTAVRFVIVNHDPISHEFILGTPAQQAAHELSAQEDHDGVPGQASIGIGQTTSVTWSFTRPLLYACHMPGHYRYGMVGVVDLAS